MDKAIIKILENEISKYENIDYDDFIKILEQEKIKMHLEKEFKNKKVKRSYLYGLTNNEFVLELFETYLDQNNIEINEDIVNKISNENVEIFKEYLNEVGRYPLLTPVEEKDLFTRYSNGDVTVKDKLIESNLRLVINIAKRYSNPNINLLDLIQEGNIGLMTAIEKFDVSKGYRFSTYATGRIRQSITRCLYNNCRTIRIPINTNFRLNNIEREYSKYLMTYGKKPSLEELASITGIPVESVKNVLESSREAVSLDKEYETETNLLSLIKSDLNVENDVIRGLLQKEIKELIETLPEDEKKLIKMRYGFDGNGLTLKEIGVIHNVSKQAIQQKEGKILEKLKIKCKKRKLDDYL